MDKIKLVIWDLDETFWKGTLSEEGVTLIDKNISLIKELCDRGIMNSIVSKNNFDDAKSKLIEFDIWDYFVFPIIDWKPKGPAIKEVIKQCQLRDINVLFLDDNHLNLEEAKYYNSALHTEDPKIIPELLDHKAFKGKDDTKHTRLKQYKVLESKFKSSLNYEDNNSFLRDSNITIEKIEGSKLLNEVDRIIELLERTNQLNYTKIRSNSDEISSLLNDKNYKSTLIKVSDNFGDYGIVGFISLNTKNNYLKHFTFSCRILNLGIEQYLYAILGFPMIDVIPDVAIKLDKSHPDWISEIKKNDLIKTKPLVSNNKTKRVFFKGGCDLGQMTFYLKNKGFDFIEETNYSAKNNFPIHQEHTQVTIDSQSLSEDDKRYVESMDFIPFTDNEYYKTKFFTEKSDLILYSLLMDYTNELYSHKTRNLVLPFGGYSLHWSDEINDKELFARYDKMNINIPKNTFVNFRKEFSHIGQISTTKFISNLEDIRSKIPSETPIVFMNGAEIDMPQAKEIGAVERHKIMNKALDEFIERTENTYLLDVRTVVKESVQLTDGIRHYNRESYRALSINLLKILASILDENIKTNIGLSTLIKDKILGNKHIINTVRIVKSLIKKQS